MSIILGIPAAAIQRILQSVLGLDNNLRYLLNWGKDNCPLELYTTDETGQAHDKSWRQYVLRRVFVMNSERCTLATSQPASIL